MKHLSLLLALVLSACASVPVEQTVQGSVVRQSGAPLSEPMTLIVQAQHQQQLISEQRQRVSFLPAYYTLRVPAQRGDIALQARLIDDQGNVRYRSPYSSGPVLGVDEVLSSEEAAVRRYDCEGIMIRYTSRTGQPTLMVGGRMELLRPTIVDEQIRYQGRIHQLELTDNGARLERDGQWLTCQRQ